MVKYQKTVLFGICIFLVFAFVFTCHFSKESPGNSIVRAETSNLPLVLARPIIKLELKYKVAAQVNEDKIGADYLQFIANYTQKQKTDQVDYNKLLDQVINISLLSQAAVKAGLQELPQVKSDVFQAKQHFYIEYAMKVEKSKYERVGRQKAILEFLKAQTYGKQIQFPAVNYDILFKDGPLTGDQKKNTLVATLENTPISLEDVFKEYGPYGEAIFTAGDGNQKNDMITRTLQLKLVENKFSQLSAEKKGLFEEVLMRVEQGVTAKAYCRLAQGVEYQKQINTDLALRMPYKVQITELELKDYYQKNTSVFTLGTTKLTFDDPQAKIIAEQGVRLEKEKIIIQKELTQLQSTAVIKKFNDVLLELGRGDN